MIGDISTRHYYRDHVDSEDSIRSNRYRMARKHRYRLWIVHSHRECLALIAPLVVALARFPIRAANEHVSDFAGSF